ncbi:MAG: hypothetical protein KDC98_14735 [Planctomycetes bacterium]|nr:hypothetical protein [Planctomycetota bacterium]
MVPLSCQHVCGTGNLIASGGQMPVRMQTLIGPSHLQSLLGMELLAVQLRRAAADETFQGGTVAMQVSLAHSPLTPLTVSRTAADNLGPNPMLAFDGTVTLPQSPPVTGQTVPWTAANVVHVPLTTATPTPFVYTGGTLCVEFLSQDVPGQGSPWWVADAMVEDLRGSAISIGDGCSAYGPQSSHCAIRTLIPGAFARFEASGTPDGLGLLAFGLPGAPSPLVQFGLPANCYLHLGASTAFLAAIDTFVPFATPQLNVGGGTAEACVRIPAVNQVLGATITAQWLDLDQLTLSNGITATIGGAVPTLDMACVQTWAGESIGSVRVDMAYVLRFEFQTPQ